MLNIMTYVLLCNSTYHDNNTTITINSIFIYHFKIIHNIIFVKLRHAIVKEGNMNPINVIKRKFNRYPCQSFRVRVTSKGTETQILL